MVQKCIENWFNKQYQESERERKYICIYLSLIFPLPVRVLIYSSFRTCIYAHIIRGLNFINISTGEHIEREREIEEIIVKLNDIVIN